MRFILVGDFSGISQLLRFMPKDNIKALMASAIRPQYLKELQELADELAIPLLIQPKWNSSAYAKFVDELAALSPDILWINSYSLIIRPDVLAIPKKGILNIHGALLPNNRGSNPIQWAIINQQYQTGVTLHEVDSGVDSGPIIDQISIPIGIADTWVDIQNTLVEATDTLIQANINQILKGNWTATVQNEALATFGYRRKEEDGFFSWSEPVIAIYNKIRALLPPIPPAFFIDEQGVKNPVEEFQTLWQITSVKYQRNLLSQLSFKDGCEIRPIESPEKVVNWIGKFEKLSHNDKIAAKLKSGLKAPDFVPFECYASISSESIGFVLLSKLDVKGKTMQAHLVFNELGMKEQREVSKITQIISDFVQAEYGVVVSFFFLENRCLKSNPISVLLISHYE